MTSPKEKSAMKNESRWPATAAASVSRPAAGTASRRPTAMTDDFGQKLREKGRRRAADWADKDLMRPLQCPFVDRTVDPTIPASPQVFLKFSSSKLVGFFFFRYGHFLVAMGALTRSKKKRTGKNKLLATIWNGTLIMKDREREREREREKIGPSTKRRHELVHLRVWKDLYFFSQLLFYLLRPPGPAGFDLELERPGERSAQDCVGHDAPRPPHRSTVPSAGGTQFCCCFFPSSCFLEMGSRALT